MAQPQAVTIDDATRIWAVAGPLLVAAAGQWWNSRQRRQEWNHEAARDRDRAEQDRAREQERWDRDRRETDHSALRVVCADFAAETARMAEWHRPSQGILNQPIVDKAFQSLQSVLLRGSPHVAHAASEIWTAARDLTKRDSRTTEADQVRALLQRYHKAHTAFVNVVRNELGITTGAITVSDVGESGKDAIQGY